VDCFNLVHLLSQALIQSKWEWFPISPHAQHVFSLWPFLDFEKGDIDWAVPMAEFSSSAGGAAPPDTQQATSQLKDVGRVRNVFPETWLWTNTSTGYTIYVQPKAQHWDDTRCLYIHS